MLGWKAEWVDPSTQTRVSRSRAANRARTEARSACRSVQAEWKAAMVGRGEEATMGAAARAGQMAQHAGQTETKVAAKDGTHCCAPRTKPNEAQEDARLAD